MQAATETLFNMKNMLSKHISQFTPKPYDVLVVGSGYGGSIAASRLSRATKSDGSKVQVCLFERGKEFRPGQYPETLADAACEIQIRGSVSKGARNALHDFVLGQEVDIYKGCGLGGTSLVNANVAIKPIPRVMERRQWPTEILAEVKRREFDKYFNRAKAMLQPTPFPSDQDLPKLKAMRAGAAALGPEASFYRPDINVNFTENWVNSAGVVQKKCTNCGNCVSGCNVGAKSTTLMNYLPDAKYNGADMYTSVEVRSIKRASNGKSWIVFYRPLDGRQAFPGSQDPWMEVENVIISGGTLGSTEILLRSKKMNALDFSDALGSRFSGNGDMLAFAFNSEYEIEKVTDNQRQTGPCITSVIDMRDVPEIENGYVIEDGTQPGVVNPAFLPLLEAARHLSSPKHHPDHTTHLQFLQSSFETAMQRKDLEVITAVIFEPATTPVKTLTDVVMSKIAPEVACKSDPDIGAALLGEKGRKTLALLVMSQDAADGKLALNSNDECEVYWSKAQKQLNYDNARKGLKTFCHSIKAEFIDDPISIPAIDKIVSVHPLGGCVMGDNARESVVNHMGQVWNSKTGSLYEGLFVMDGAIIPTCLGVNPLLTISAISERAVEKMADSKGWEISIAPTPPPQPEPAPEIGVTFTETMRGFWYEHADTFEDGYEKGKQDPTNMKLEFTLTIDSENLKDFTTRPDHRAKISGTVTCPTLSENSLDAIGTFDLFVNDPDNVDQKLMRYNLIMRSTDQKTYAFEGVKHVKHGVLHMWHDTTTLFTSVYEIKNGQRETLGKGILHIEPVDFMRQLTTMKATNALGIRSKIESLAEFGGYFAGALFEVYGGILAWNEPGLSPRQPRTLRLPEPQKFDVLTGDNKTLKLTRYYTTSQSTKGPVLLVHGMSVSSRLFLVDTIETSLTEYLYQEGFDVWLVDWRVSCDLSYAQDVPNLDVAAEYDFEPTVNKILEITGKKEISAFAHCLGAIAFFLALCLGKLEGKIRRLVSSNVGMHVMPPILKRAEAAFKIPSLLNAVGTTSVDFSAHYPNTSVVGRIAGLVVPWAPPKEICHSKTCHRMSFFYGLLWQHEQLANETHEYMHELFGESSMKVFEHLATMVRAGYIVDVNGKDVYLKNAQKYLNFPIHLFSGGENLTWLPVGTEKDLEFLQKFPNPQQYTRTVIPNYGHLDCVFGRNAAVDVFPQIRDNL